MLDIDLNFQIDILELFHQFDHFGKDQIIGVSNELTPYYSVKFKQYQELHPGLYFILNLPPFKKNLDYCGSLFNKTKCILNLSVPDS